MLLIGDWQNQNGSILRIVEQVPGGFSGLYFSKKGDVSSTDAHDVIGVINKRVISFLVDWGNADATTAFCGRIIVGDPTVFHTIWILGRMWADDKPTEPWNTFTTNADKFTLLDKAIA